MVNRVGEWVKSWADRSNIQVEYYFESTSTNDIAKDYSYQNADPVVVVTESQTRGRGRGNNTWVNPEPGTALLSSWSFGLEKPPQPITTPLMGLAVFRALTQTLKPRGLSLKAPNDIYVGKKKVGGLLIEVISEGSHHRIVVGLGLNVLEAPSLDVADKLAGHTEVAIDQECFLGFLNVLIVEMTQAIDEGTAEQLSPQSREELLFALNQNPNLKQKYTSVEADGSLKIGETIIDWHSL